MRLKLEFNSSLIRWLRGAAVPAHCVTCLTGNYAHVHPLSFSLSLSLSHIIYTVFEIFFESFSLSLSYKYEKQLVDNDVQVTQL